MTFAVEFAVPLLDAVVFAEEKLPTATGDGVTFRREEKRQPRGSSYTG